jgi:hypothetical protein
MLALKYSQFWAAGNELERVWKKALSESYLYQRETALRPAPVADVPDAPTEPTVSREASSPLEPK